MSWCTQPGADIEDELVGHECTFLVYAAQASLPSPSQEKEKNTITGPLSRTFPDRPPNIH